MEVVAGRLVKTITLAIWIQYTNMVDGRTNTGRQQRPLLCIASRGKNDNYSHMLKWKSFKCILVTVMMSDDQQ